MASLHAAVKRHSAYPGAASRVVVSMWMMLRPVLLTLASAASFVVAGFMASTVIGFVVLGVVAAVLDVLLSGGDG